MSTILKALRRLEREKQPEPGKALRDEVVAFLPGEPQAPRSGRTLWWVGAGGAAILVLGLLWAVSVEREREVGARVAPAPLPEAIAPAPAPTEEALAVPAPLAEVPSPRTPSTPRAPAPSEPTSSPTPAGVDELSSSAGAGAPEPAEPAARPYRLPDPEPLRAFAAPVPEVAPQAEPVGRAAEPAASPAPEAHVESTTWHPDPSRRRAVVSAGGRAAVTLREGDAIGELVVLRVEPSAVVFLYQGREIARRVGR